MMIFKQAGPVGESTPSSLQQCGGNQKEDSQATDPQEEKADSEGQL